MAGKIFYSSKYYSDKKLKKIGGKGVYAKLIENSFNKENNYFVVHKTKNISDGFVMFSVFEEVIKVILMGVSPKMQNKGIGGLLWHELEFFGKSNNLRGIKVGTQLRNIAAMNFYSRNGCHITSAAHVYHLWK
jgi:GNAT superfamily N-acetyltransferase